MPFDFKNPEEEQQEQAPEKPQPILHKPRASGLPWKRIILIVGGILVLCAVAFIVFKTNLLKKKKAEPPKIVETVTPQKADTTAQVTAQPAPPPETNPPQVREEPKKPPLKKVEPTPRKGLPPVVRKEPKKETAPPKISKPPSAPVGSGQYTIFIGSFKQKSLADDEASRWNEAGYQAFVTERKGWHRVSLGKYGSKDEARQQAEKLKEAFETGYWIDQF